MAESARNTNLARVRDNQRRSRARRKEYLSELESKYQNCERVGVEANAEIQTAARLVLADNKRLRAMLKSLGVSDADIDCSCQTPNVARTLEGMLSQRRRCGGDEAVPYSEGAGSRPGLAFIRPVASSSPQHEAQVDSHAFESLDHWSDGNIFYAADMNQVVSHQYQLVTNPRSPGKRPTPPHQEEYSLSRTFESPTLWSDGSRFHTTDTTQPVDEQQQPPPQPSQPTTTTYHPQPPKGSTSTGSCTGPRNSKPCHEIADTIRMMRPDIGLELEAELGCAGDGEACNVSDFQAFDVLDRMAWSG